MCVGSIVIQAKKNQNQKNPQTIKKQKLLKNFKSIYMRLSKLVTLLNMYTHGGPVQ